MAISRSWIVGLCVGAPLYFSGAARAHDEILVLGHSPSLIGEARAGSEGVVAELDLKDRPLSRVGELVENVPGVIATQHSGTGKANQYFLRGFNLDHGTDFAGFVDGVPINFRSHGHGQGYLDLNFLIPETVGAIRYRKGPYYADVGDFSAAGTVAFATVDTLARPIASLTLGGDGYFRGFGAGSAALGQGNWLAALDYTHYAGPWTLDEDLRSAKALLKYSAGSPSDGWSLTFNAYDAEWTSTDQVPERAVANGLISRFGFIDPDLGGDVQRYALSGDWRRGDTHASAYALYYDFQLTSNFTYFLNDPAFGDEFQQRDRRTVYGGDFGHTFQAKWGGRDAALSFGGDVRYDAIDNVGLYQSVGGQPFAIIRQDQVDQYGVAIYADARVKLAPRVRAFAGLRSDFIGYDVNAELSANAGDGDDTFVTPKAGLAWQFAESLEAYLNYGESFHSNDVRGATITIDPATGGPADRVPVFARARGGEVGARFNGKGIASTLSAFYLELDSELVYVGDGGSTEPNAGSRRLGVEATVNWAPTSRLRLDAAAAYTDAAFEGAPAGQDRIPGALETVFSGGVRFDWTDAATATVRVRHFGEAPLIEDNSVRSRPTTLVNAGINYSFARAQLSVEVLNLLDAEDNDITYFYASRLPGEPAAGVEDRHGHPVEPFQVRATMRVTF